MSLSVFTASMLRQRSVQTRAVRANIQDLIFENAALMPTLTFMSTCIVVIWFSFSHVNPCSTLAADARCSYEHQQETCCHSKTATLLGFILLDTHNLFDKSSCSFFCFFRRFSLATIGELYHWGWIIRACITVLSIRTSQTGKQRNDQKAKTTRRKNS